MRFHNLFVNILLPAMRSKARQCHAELPEYTSGFNTGLFHHLMAKIFYRAPQ
jgi:hypothetical protein